MLITEKKLRRVIRDLLREATQAEKIAAVKGKNIRQAKKSIRKGGLSPEEKKEALEVLTLLKKMPKQIKKRDDIDAKRSAAWRKAIEEETRNTDRFAKKYARLDDKHKKFLSGLKGDWKDADEDMTQALMSALVQMDADGQDEPQSAAVVEPDEYAERDAAQAKRAEEEKKRTDKTAPLGTEFDIGEDWTYKITDSDRVKIQDTGDLHFTVASGPSNVDKSYKLTAKDKNHKIVQKVKRLHPHLIDSLNF